MQLIYDNIVASMVGAAVLMIMVGTHQRNQISAAEATAHYMLRQQVIDFTDVLQRDMQNLSSVIDVEETDNEFRFRAQTEVADTTKRLVTYERQSAGTLPDEEGNQVAVYRIVRYVDGQVAGGSLSSISEWSIVALNEDESTILSPADAAAVRVTIAALPPIRIGKNEGLAMQGTRWQATYRPHQLRFEEL